ncbi:MAG: hypothetical protein EXQ79_01045 [Acidimicrobiia bacterium]|nr:hypothetical protein [Acidimicrobiia bacterium]
MRLRIALPILLLSLSLLGTGSAGAASPSGGAQPVIQVDTNGGFVPFEVMQGNVPEVTVTADGRVITEGPRKSYDRMARFRVARIDDARIQELIDRAREIGLLTKDEALDYGQPGVTDMPDTTVTITVDGDTFSTSVYALSFDSNDLTPEQQGNRDALQAFIAEVADASPRRPYEVKRLAVLATRAEDGATGNAVEWPLDDLATTGEPAQLGERCLIVSGDDLDAVLPLAKSAHFGTLWQSADKNWRLVFRPLLSQERTCKDINAV